MRAGLEALARPPSRDRAGARRRAPVRVARPGVARDRGGRPRRRDSRRRDDRHHQGGRCRRPRWCARSTAPRLRGIQTPQAFAFDALLAAHRKALAAGREDFTDDAALAEWAGMTVDVFEGEAGNIKLTTPEDFAQAEARELAALGDIRTGNGYDVHAFVGRRSRLARRREDPARARRHRPLGRRRRACMRWSTPSWARSPTATSARIFRRAIRSGKAPRPTASCNFAVERVAQRGGRVAHLDLTVVCEAPKIGPHRDAMRARIARDRRHLASTASASRRPPASSLASPGGAKASPRMATATVRLPWSAP